MAESDKAKPDDGNDIEPAAAPSAGAGSDSSDQASNTFDIISEYLKPGRENVMLIYILYLAGMVPAFGGVPIFVGFVIALLNRRSSDGTWNSHYDFMVRQAVIGLIAAAISFVLIFVAIGIVGFVLIAVWWMVRSVKGLLAASRREPIADPMTYSW